MGLAIGLASFILIFLYVYDEYSFDKYHSKADRIFRVTSVLDYNGVGEKSSSQAFPLGQAMLEEFPEYVESYVRFFNMQRSQFLVSYGDVISNETRFFYCDPNVFSVFDFQLIKGDKNLVLDKPFSIVITESTAKKYFDESNPIGKKFKLDNSFEFEVTGIVQDVPQQSHFKFDFLASFSSLPYVYNNSKILDGWVWNPCWTYLVLKKPESAPILESKFRDFEKEHFHILNQGSYNLSLQPLTDIHLKSNLDYEIEKNGSEKYLHFLMILGFLILIIASLNYVNLATAGAAKRIKEIGIRKVSGASRIQLIMQFLEESLFTSLLSLLLAISLVEIFLPAFSDLSGKVISNDFRFRKETLLGLGALWFFTGIISGLYPAFYLASLKTSNLIKNKLKLNSHSAYFRKGLVLVQYSFSIILIITTIGVFRQLRYLHNANLGFKKNNIVLLDAGNEISGKYSLFREQLLKDPKIKNVTAMNYVIGSNYNTYPFSFENASSKEFQFYPALVVRDDFVKTFEIEIVAGKDFSSGKEKWGKELLVNEEMVKYLGYDKSEEIIGKSFRTGWDEEKIIGVFSNINVTSLHHKVEPFVINMAQDSFARAYETKFVAIRVSQDKINESISAIENAWDNMGFEIPFEYKLLSDVLDSHYKSEDLLGNLARIFTFLSIIISLLGIWGLTAYITESRIREIGIRKAIGASLLNIVGMINKELIFVIVISILIAWPLAYLMLANWINSFAYNDFLGIWSFILASMLAILIAVLTISHKAVGAGRKNPIDVLRFE
jgi:putative ABC transport system permease protein